MEVKKLYMVEFGDVAPGMFSTKPSVFVIAKDYNEAAFKATWYIKNKKKAEPPPVLTSDGSLNPDAVNPQENDTTVCSVKIVGDVIL